MAPLIMAATIAVTITQLHTWQRITDEIHRMGVRTATRYTAQHDPVMKQVYVSAIRARRVVAADADAEVEGKITNGTA